MQHFENFFLLYSSTGSAVRGSSDFLLFACNPELLCQALSWDSAHSKGHHTPHSLQNNQAVVIYLVKLPPKEQKMRGLGMLNNLTYDRQGEHRELIHVEH